MLIREFHRTRKDGVNIFVYHSDENKYIQIKGNDTLFENVYDIENTKNEYFETDIEIVEEIIEQDATR